MTATSSAAAAAPNATGKAHPIAATLADALEPSFLQLSRSANRAYVEVTIIGASLPLIVLDANTNRITSETFDHIVIMLNNRMTINSSWSDKLTHFRGRISQTFETDLSDVTKAVMAELGKKLDKETLESVGIHFLKSKTAPEKNGHLSKGVNDRVDLFSEAYTETMKKLSPYVQMASKELGSPGNEVGVYLKTDRPQLYDCLIPPPSDKKEQKADGGSKV